MSYFCHKLLSFNSGVSKNSFPTSLPYNVLEGIKKIVAYPEGIVKGVVQGIV